MCQRNYIKEQEFLLVFRKVASVFGGSSDNCAYIEARRIRMYITAGIHIIQDDDLPQRQG